VVLAAVEVQVPLGVITFPQQQPKELQQIQVTEEQEPPHQFLVLP
jgi:hypothetical protein